MSSPLSFDELGLALDKRLDKAVMRCGFQRPTEVQARALPLALAGKDVLVRASTGSGKTLAFLLPLLNKVLAARDLDTQAEDKIRGIILVPTRELVAQVFEVANKLSFFCRDIVRIVALSNEKADVQEKWLKANPDVVISTPGRLATHVESLKLRESVEMFVVDEADLLFSFGCADDVNKIVSHLPRTVQSMLMSATLNDNVNQLQKLILHSPVIVKVDRGNQEGRLAQWFCNVKRADKNLLLFALLRLNILSGKTLFFVNSVQRAYSVKLILEQFHIKSAVLNAELPLNSRLHILKQFNAGVFDYLIATDEAMSAAHDADASPEGSGNSGGGVTERTKPVAGADEDADLASAEVDSEVEDLEKAGPLDESVEESETPVKTAKKRKLSKAKRKRTQQADEFGVARGVDFKMVSTVVNLDMPSSVASYTHRIGRTARGGASGTALTLVEEKSNSDFAMLSQIQASQPQCNGKEQPECLPFDLKEIEAFRYRVEDVSRTVTAKAVKSARLREIKQEMLNSQKLKSYFEENPNEKDLIQHAIVLQPKAVKRHLNHIPDYLIPSALKSGAELATSASSSSYVPSFYSKRQRTAKLNSRDNKNHDRKMRPKDKIKWEAPRKGKSRKKNPLF